MESEKNNQITNGHTMQPKRLPAESTRDKIEKVALLARLQTFYFQPGQRGEQIEAMFEDMLDDLSGLSVADVERACKLYRTNPENKFFPTSGQLIGAKDPSREIPCRLPTFKAHMYELADNVRPAKLMSVSDVLRKHGRLAAADAWEARSAKRPGTAL